MRYGSDDRPPVATMWLAALQLCSITTVFIIYPLVLLRETGVPPATGAAIIALSFLMLGIATVVQVSVPFGPGILVPVTFTPAYLVPAIAAVKLGGLPLAFGMMVFAGVVEILLSIGFRRLRALFPPEVSGLVVLLVGLTIGEIAMRNLAALAVGAEAGVGGTVLLLTFGIAAGLTVWGRGRASSFALLSGLVLGAAAASLLGLLAPADQAAIAAAPWLALPQVDHLGLAFDPSLILPFVIGAFAATTKAAALTALARKPAGAAGQGDPAAQMAAGVRADGVGTVLAGLLGTIGVNPSTSAVALTVSTGLASRSIAWAMLVICAGIALMPKLALSIVFLPKPVISGMLLFTGCLVLANGLQMLAEVKLDPRRALVVGLGVFAAIAPLAVPDLWRAVPASLAPVVASPFILGSAVALLANLVLRIGSGRTLRLTVAEPGRAEALAAAWPADPDLPEATRAAVAVLLADHAARADQSGPVEVVIRISEFAVRIRLRPAGTRRAEGLAWLAQIAAPPRGLSLAR